MNNDYDQQPIQPGGFDSAPDGPVGVNEGPQPNGQFGQAAPENGGKKSPGKLIGLVALVLLLVAGGVYGLLSLLKGKETPTPEPQPDKPIESDIKVSKFDLSFLKLENNKVNAIYSPLSIKYATSLLRDGASGETKTEIENVLGDIQLTKYDNIEGVLSLANAVIIRNDFTERVKQSYISNAQQKYNAEVLYDEMKDASALDSWIDNKTFGLIKQSGANVNPDSRMILANALAIQMDWDRQFEADSTYGSEFTKADGTTINATMMNIDDRIDDIKYYKDDTVTVVSKNLKDYDGTQLEFVAIMPEEDLGTYVETVEPDQVNELLGKRVGSSTAAGGVVLNVPKFKFDYQLDFINDLNQLGINTAFTDAADFSEMDEGGELKVGDAVHKATIDFSEEGIKAAAITVYLMNMESAMMEDEPPVVININKPFLFLIRDKNTGENWFVGTVYEPNLWENDEALYRE